MLKIEKSDRNTALRNKIARLGPELIKKLITRWIEEIPIQDCDVIIENLDQLIKKYGIRTISTMILTRWWPNMTQSQLAQIDILSVLNDTSSYPFVASKCVDYEGRDHLIDISNSQLENGLKKAFDKIYRFHVYTERSSDESMSVTRVQLFEAFQESITNTHKPFFFATQRAHSIIFHSPSTDTNSKLIFQSLESFAGSNLAFKRVLGKPSKSLRELNILMGLPSINTTGFGIWSVYSRTEKLEPQPLSTLESHPLLGDYNSEESSVSSKEYVKKVAMLKFKGSVNGIKRKRKHLDRRRNDRVFNLNNELEDPELTKYDSLLPVKKVDFNYIDKETGISVKISLNGRDVFGGLHELCERNLIDVDKIPDWLAGDNADQSGTIENGKFIPDQKVGII